MTRIQKIREDIFQLQCLDRETSIVSVDDLEWTLRQLQLAEALVRDLSNLTRAGTTPDASDDGQHASILRRAGAFLGDLSAELSIVAPRA